MGLGLGFREVYTAWGYPVLGSRIEGVRGLGVRMWSLRLARCRVVGFNNQLEGSWVLRSML